MQGRVDPSWQTDYWVPGLPAPSQVSQLSFHEPSQPVAYLLVPGPPDGFLVRPVYAPIQQPPPKRTGFG